MRVKRTKASTKYTYSGDLEKELEKAKTELEKKKGSQERVFILWQYQKAKKAYEDYERRIDDLEGFIHAAEEHIKQEGADNA